VDGAAERERGSPTRGGRRRRRERTWWISLLSGASSGSNLGVHAAKEVDPMGDIMEMAAKFEEVLKAGDFGGMTDLVKEYATDDFVEEWPQSGERLTKSASLKLAESYPQMSGTTPKFKYKRMLGGGDAFIIEGTIDYGDGVPVSYVGIGEIRDGKVSRMTEYFANPFEAPAWRADFVQKMEPATV
jgi:hypothetical protein